MGITTIVEMGFYQDQDTEFVNIVRGALREYLPNAELQVWYNVRELRLMVAIVQGGLKITTNLDDETLHNTYPREQAHAFVSRVRDILTSHLRGQSDSAYDILDVVAEV